MKSRLHLVGLASILLAMFGRAEGCSCSLDSATEEAQIMREFEEAQVVFVAKLISVRQTPEPDAPKYLTEDAEFVVSDVLKGGIVIGQKVRIRSSLGPVRAAVVPRMTHRGLSRWKRLVGRACRPPFPRSG